jgi:hypothetical protein
MGKEGYRKFKEEFTLEIFEHRFVEILGETLIGDTNFFNQNISHEL